MTDRLAERVAQAGRRAVDPQVESFARDLAGQSGAAAALFYGSNLRTGSLEGVLDFYLLHEGPPRERIWPLVSYHEKELGDGSVLRAKAATMSLDRFLRAARGESRDTTIWARFVQPSALVWTLDDTAREAVERALGEAAKTAARLAAVLGPKSGSAEDYWKALFRETYRAEFRVEAAGREDSILQANAAHFDGLLPAAWEADGLPFTQDGTALSPVLDTETRRSILLWWKARRRLGKPLNLLRLAKATTTFEGAARYATWKVERHTGVAIDVSPLAERYPLLAAPGALARILRARAHLRRP